MYGDWCGIARLFTNLVTNIKSTASSVLIELRVYTNLEDIQFFGVGVSHMHTNRAGHTLHRLILFSIDEIIQPHSPACHTHSELYSSRVYIECGTSVHSWSTLVLSF